MFPRQLLCAGDATPQIPTSGLTCDDVNQRIQESLERQHKRLRVIEAEYQLVRMSDGVETVDGGGHPGDEESAKEEEGNARIEPGLRVSFRQSMVAGQTADVEDFRGGDFALVRVG